MDKDRHIDIMGIANITGNSYFPESRCLGEDGLPDLEKTSDRIGRMLEEGASIIDLGACSTRPGSDPVGEEEEWRRLRPVLEEVRRTYPGITLSIDTWWASVVEKAFDLCGPLIVNDISAGEDDPAMLDTVARLGLRYVAMHKRGDSKTMQTLCQYGDVTRDVVSYFKGFARRAEEAGIRDWILDPGFGFAKTVEQNYQLVRELEAFQELGRPVLVGVSRKSMIFKKFGITPEESLAQTQVIHLAALQNGADILRVHDVAEAARTVSLYRIL